MAYRHTILISLALPLMLSACAKSDSEMPSGDAPECDDGEPLVGYPDADGDGFGTPIGRITVCDALPEGYASTSDDCDDENELNNPDGIEVCDGEDNDCDFDTDEEAIDQRTFYADEDSDGYGDDSASVTACSLPDGYVLWGGDCDSTEPFINPAAVEICDEIDNDCNDVVDDAATEDMFPWYPDEDEDGHGDFESPIYACSAPDGTTGSPSDCDDTDATIHLGAAELCDGLDNDCDGDVDESDDCEGDPTDDGT